MTSTTTSSPPPPPPSSSSTTTSTTVATIRDLKRKRFAEKAIKSEADTTQPSPAKRAFQLHTLNLQLLESHTRLTAAMRYVNTLIREAATEATAMPTVPACTLCACTHEDFKALKETVDQLRSTVENYKPKCTL